MEGFLTKAIIGGILLSMAGVVLYGFFNGLLGNYDAEILAGDAEVLNQYAQKSQELQAVAYDAQERQQNSSIDQTVTDFAQLQDVAGNEQQKKEGLNVFTTALNQLQQYISFDPVIARAMLGIIATLMAAAAVYMIIGRNL